LSLGFSSFGKDNKQGKNRINAGQKSLNFYERGNFILMGFLCFNFQINNFEI
jgi:hypothetical protein